MALDDGVATLVGRHRLVLVFADSAEDGSFQRQQALFNPQAEELASRNTVVVPLAGASAVHRSLRTRYGAPETGFAVVLVGLDGGAKLNSVTPLDPGTLFSTIDSMPMRQAEIKRAAEE